MSDFVEVPNTDWKIKVEQIKKTKFKYSFKNV